MRVDTDGWLVADPGDPEVLKIPSKRTSALVVTEPLGVVWHWSADPIDERGHGDSIALAKSIAELPGPTEHAASWHVLIDRDGTLVQSIPFTMGSWHVGKPGNIGGKDFLNINKATVGIELENAGRLLQGPDGEFYGWPFYKNPGAPAGQLVWDTRFIRKETERAAAPQTSIGATTWEAGVFDAYTPAQEVSALALTKALVARFGWRPEQCRYGHGLFVPPSYKEDPGPLWLGPNGVMENLLAQLFPATP